MAWSQQALNKPLFLGQTGGFAGLPLLHSGARKDREASGSLEIRVGGHDWVTIC